MMIFVQNLPSKKQFLRKGLFLQDNPWDKRSAIAINQSKTSKANMIRRVGYSNASRKKKIDL